MMGEAIQLLQRCVPMLEAYNVLVWDFADECNSKPEHDKQSKEESEAISQLISDIQFFLSGVPKA